VLKPREPRALSWTAPGALRSERDPPSAGLRQVRAVPTPHVLVGPLAPCGVGARSATRTPRRAAGALRDWDCRRRRCMPNTAYTFLISISCVLCGRWYDRGAPVVQVVPGDTAPAPPASEFSCACACPSPSPSPAVVGVREVVVSQCSPYLRVAWFLLGCICAPLVCGVCRLCVGLVPTIELPAQGASGEPKPRIPIVDALERGGPVTPGELRRRRKHG
jgi:hypothetical protein